MREGGDKMILCKVCKSRDVEFQVDELVCMTCGASFDTELLGYYPEGSSNRIECGEEFDKWYKENKDKCLRNTKNPTKTDKQDG